MFNTTPNTNYCFKMWTKFPLKNVVFVKKKKSFLFDSNTTFSVVFVSNTTLVVISFKILGIFFYFFAKHWEYTKFISKVRRNLWHQDDLILNPLQLLKLWVGVKVRVRVPFAWSCREDMLCWWPWPPSPFQYGDKDIHIQAATTCRTSSQRIWPKIIFS